MIDHCTSCRGLWVVRGEGARLRDLVRARGPAPGPIRFREVAHPDAPDDPEPWYVPVLQTQVRNSGLQWKWILGSPIGGWRVGRHSSRHTVLEPMIAAVPAALLFAWFFHQDIGPLLTISLMVVGTMLALFAAGLTEQGD